MTEANSKDTNAMEDSEVQDFLRYAITHIENRIRKIDTDARILTAVQIGGLILFNQYAKGQLSDTILYRVVVAVLIAWALVVILLLLHAIRPTRKLLGLRARPGPRAPQETPSTSLMWYKEGRTPSLPDIQAQVQSLTSEGAIAESVQTLWTCQSLMFKKYRIYRWAMCFLKWEIALLTIGIPLLILMKGLRSATP